MQCLNFNSRNPLEAMECLLSQGGPEDENEVYLRSKLFKLGPVPPQGRQTQDCQTRIHFGREYLEASERLASRLT